MLTVAETLFEHIDRARDEIVDFASELVRIPTVNPPGDHYEPACLAIGNRLKTAGFDVDYPVAEHSAEHSARYPRMNVIGRKAGTAERPLLHLNGHIDVVPAGSGWTVDPFAGVVTDGKLFGRGSCDMKAGIAAAFFAVEALRRAGVELAGTVEISGTVDEESGGFAGAAFLCETGRIAQASTDYVIIPEPLNVDRVCIGHRGVYWFKVTARGRSAHGSMPFLGVSAIDRMTALLGQMHAELMPKLQSRVTATPVVPDGARRATMNVNSILGGQAGQTPQSPCVADTCEAIFDRRFLREEGFDSTRQEIEAWIRDADGGTDSLTLEDLMIVHPVETPNGSPVTASLARAIDTVLGRPAQQIASPGTYDHKHVARIAGVEHCVAYGPGILELAHQADEYCDIDDLVNATKVLALTIAELIGAPDEL